jgi:hypothetical protein
MGPFGWVFGLLWLLKSQKPKAQPKSLFLAVFLEVAAFL